MNNKSAVSATSMLSSRHQLAMPSDIRKAIQAKPGDTYIWSYDPSSGQTTLKPMPSDWGKYLRGIGKHLSDDVDATQYVKQLRQDRQW